MIAKNAVLSILAVAVGILLSMPYAAFAADGADLYKAANTIKLGGEGRWDYITPDPDTHRLYVTRTTHTMVIDVGTGKVVADIPGQKGNHGVAVVAKAGRGFITDGEDGAELDLLDAALGFQKLGQSAARRVSGGFQIAHGGVQRGLLLP